MLPAARGPGLAQHRPRQALEIEQRRQEGVGRAGDGGQLGLTGAVHGDVEEGGEAGSGVDGHVGLGIVLLSRGEDGNDGPEEAAGPAGHRRRRGRCLLRAALVFHLARETAQKSAFGRQLGLVRWLASGDPPWHCNIGAVACCTPFPQVLAS